MRKLHQVMIVAAAAGSLSAIGAGTGVAYESGPTVSDLYRPYQECSPQTVGEADIPIAVLGLSETFDTTCGQFNNAFTG
ncbi:hypothetical protein [Streptomyces viridochromogenes]|uniref:hypothetical protein n=1 Tax=Streptomyces viridochromogenes TaxID=1938 RepID=UPI00069EF14A|nr:hypothetical protein [Streptomyces viridochromogenes]KOG16131.1 hypothetical protein ADK36_28145 [Streptomyces viridochromogenes]KOG16362.1 hypothetical protein ADK35_27030 [Streptomyces viridochromogenes]